MIRVGIAGLGFMGMVHFLSYAKVRGARVVAICDRRPERLAGDWRGIRGNFGPPGTKIDLAGVRSFANLDDMLADNDVDLVDITLPPALHPRTTLDALANGKHVFCEKPMALELADCRRMLRAANKAQRQLAIGHVLSFFPEYAWALKTVRSRKYGQLLGGSFRRVIAEPTWIKNFWSNNQVGGPMFDLHVHDAHFIRLLFGMPRSVVARGSTHRGLPKYWHSLFEFSNDICVEATCGTIDQPARSFDHGFEIRLERATLTFQFAVTNGVGQYLCPPTILDNRGQAKVVKLSNGDPMEAFRAEIREVVDCVARHRPSEILNGTLAADAIAICHAEAKSIHSGRAARL